jgi:hypothetical protein
MIQWFEARIALWNAQASLIGVSPAMLAELSARIAAARAAYDSFRAAFDIAHATTTSFHAATDDLRNFGQQVVNTIRANGSALNAPAVFTAAQVPPPTTAAGSLPVPPAPQRLHSRLVGGDIHLRWRAPRGGYKGYGGGSVFFTIERSLWSIDGRTIDAHVNNGWKSIGVTGGRRFIDSDVPVGLRAASYRITARRGSERGGSTHPTMIEFGTAPPIPAPMVLPLSQQTPAAQRQAAFSSPRNPMPGKQREAA